MSGTGAIEVEVVYALPRRRHAVTLSLPPGATVRDALVAVGGRAPFDGLDLESVPVGIFGDRVGRDHPLAHRDRLEIYRPLEVDPREARRRRAG